MGTQTDDAARASLRDRVTQLEQDAADLRQLVDEWLAEEERSAAARAEPRGDG